MPAAYRTHVRTPGQRQRELAERARTIVTRYGARRCAVTDLARHLGCTVFHLSRTFRHVHGYTLSAYRVEVRLARAIVHLDRDPTASLTDVALEAGFSSHSHFTACFRKRFGTTPSRFVSSRLIAPAQTPASAAPCGTCNR